MGFLEAQNKLEAVARISNLTNSGPETLGPGSKEHKSVLSNLALGLGLQFDEKATKQDLGRLILEFLGGHWLGAYESVGQTITLKGLNALLLNSTQFFESKGSLQRNFGLENLEQEVNQMSQIIVENTPLTMHGKTCVEEMRLAEDKNWKQTEWQGFYFEMLVESALTNSIGGGRQTFFNTEFDYVRNFIWDLKMHSSTNKKGKASTSLILNDIRAIDQAVEERGLGFIILSAIPTYDREFTKWHKFFRGGGDTESIRTLKSNFVSQRLDMFYIPDTSKLVEAKENSQLSVMNQGRNSNGKPRPAKYSLDISKVRDTDLQVFTHNFI